MSILKTYRLKLIFILIFILLFGIFYTANGYYRDKHIQDELDKQIDKLQLHYDITQEHYKRDVISVSKVMSTLQMIPKIMKKAYRANKQERSDLREELYQYLLPRYKAMRQRGYLQFQFVFPNNVSFLRMHKPKKFGDDLSDIRYSFKYTSITHLPISGFERGRTTHGFRNVFPIFDSKNNYLGAYEISHSSDSIQYNLSSVNKVHSHFLIHEDIFDTKMWDRKYKNLNYMPSIENDQYKFTTLDTIDHKKKDYREKYIIKPHKKLIKENMKNSKRFAIYTKNDNRIIVISFLPINDTRGETQAYLVSYSKNPYILDILNDYKESNILAFFILLILLILIYKHIVYKNFLEIKTKEQRELLSLFDQGDTAIFKWRNDDTWSVSYVSKNIKHLTGYTKEEFESGIIDYANIINIEDKDRVKKIVSYVINNHINLFRHESYRITTKGGEIKWLLNTSKIIKNSQGEITHFLGYVTDITDIKNQELTLIKSEKDLELLTNTLQKEVDKKVEENLQKDKLLQEQTKLSAMGEMIGAISHQWRQPLNALSINIQNLDDDYADGLIDETFIERYIKKQVDIIEFMSNTIDDFRNFFKIDKVAKNFSIRDAIESTISIQYSQFKNHNIDIEILGDDFYMTAIRSEFKQVILNILSNAKDAIISSEIENGKITIGLEEPKIIIGDNGGGIPDNIIDRVFEPYFTTKEEGEGRGIGLYMSKMTTEKSLHGSLSVYNSQDGASFIIDLLQNP